MNARRRLLDDLAKIVTATAGVLQGAGREAELLARQRLERLVERLDLVGREEFDAVKAMAAEARAENARLAERLDRLERPEARGRPERPARSRRKAP
jgi:BMFP domain-containing protein YqiC